MKICVLIIFITMPWISAIGDWALGWTEGNEKLQIAFVMMIFPLIMNAMQYYIIDSFIKKKVPEHDGVEDLDDGRGRFNQLRSSLDEEDIDSEDEGVEERGKMKTHNLAATEVYDPNLDGNAPTIIGSSSSRHVPSRSKLLKSDLATKE